jgi:hypothetical protein
MGRNRWTSRLTVEECHSIEIGALVRAGAFVAHPATLSSITIDDNSGQRIWGITFRIFPDRTGATAVHFYHPVASTLSSPEWIQQQIVQITSTKCNFGGFRRWFKCSIVRDGYLCKRRTRTLYATPYEKLLGCRQCHNLTYESAQTHDKRIDQLSKLSLQDFNRVLATGTLRQRLLAFQASTERLKRMQRWVTRMHNGGRQFNRTIFSQKHGFSPNSPSK